MKVGIPLLPRDRVGIYDTSCFSTMLMCSFSIRENPDIVILPLQFILSIRDFGAIPYSEYMVAQNNPPRYGVVGRGFLGLRSLARSVAAEKIKWFQLVK